MRPALIVLGLLGFLAFAGHLFLAGSIFGADQNPHSRQANRELEINVRLDAADAGQSKVPKFRVELRNTGENDLTLNLGIMLANGRKQYPTNIILIVTDPEGKARRFELGGPAYIAGREDPLVVPLATGTTFSLPVDMGKYVAAAPNNVGYDFEYKLKPGAYFVEAQFHGRGVTQQEADLDSQGITLMPYWTGTISSNRLAFKVAGK
jgi:hypothetical protein